MNRLDFTVRQKGTFNKYCYYAGFNGQKHMWTKKLKEASLFLDAIEAFKFRDKLKFNHARVIAIISNSAGNIIRTFKPSRNIMQITTKTKQ